MTETPVWVTEKALTIASAYADGSYKYDCATHIESALSLAYQQGKQDGRREMKERAAGVIAERKAVYKQKRDARSIFDEDSLTQHEMFAHTVEAHDWLAAAIRRLDEVQDA